jgi:hypothetical protein
MGTSHATILKTLKIGSYSSEVKELQSGLGVKATGYYGPATAKAVKIWQAKNNLPTTGYFGAMSRNIWNNESTAGSNSIVNNKLDIQLNKQFTLYTNSSIQGNFLGKNIIVSNLQFHDHGDAGHCILFQGFCIQADISIDGNIKYGFSGDFVNYVNYISLLGYNLKVLNTDGINYITFIVEKSTQINHGASVKVLSPNGGEVYTENQQVNLTWNMANMPSDYGVNVFLQVYDNSGNLKMSNTIIGPTDNIFIPSTSNDDGQENIKLPKVSSYCPNNSCLFKIRIYAFTDANHNVSVYDDSDNYFTINNISSVCIRYNSDGSCSTSTSTPLIVPGTTPAPRIAFWPGKVNQHVDLTTGNWVTDPDGKSGGWPSTMYPNDYGDRKLDYCKKWYPNTLSVASSSMETISNWQAAVPGNYTATVMTYQCLSGPKVNPSITLLSPNGGETFIDGQKIPIVIKTNIFLEKPQLEFQLNSYNGTGNLLSSYSFNSFIEGYSDSYSNQSDFPFSGTDGKYNVTLPTLSSLKLNCKLYNTCDLDFGKHFKIWAILPEYRTNNNMDFVGDYSDNYFTINSKN